MWSPGVLGIWGEWLFIFRELGSTGYYFPGFGEQAHSFGDLGSPAKSKKKSQLKGKAFISFDFFKKKIFDPILTIIGNQFHLFNISYSHFI